MKKNIIKLFNICAIALFVLAQTSCSDFLDQEPQGEWVKGDYDGNFQSDVFTLYSQARNFDVTSGTPALAIHNFRSEDAEKGSTASDGDIHGAMYDNFEYSTSNGMILSYYNNNYAIIHTANRIFQSMKDTIATGYELTQEDLVNKAETHFFRAFAYFNLVRAFGEVPYIDFKVVDASEAIVPKSPASKIYELIDSDLTEAAKFLPSTWESKFIGRLTWGAARSLHAKAYLTRNDWANTYAAATEVINSGMYDLNTPFDKIFRESGENSSESIFEIQCTATAALPASLTIGSQFAAVQGVRGAGDWNLGWGWHTPSQLLADAFEPGDPRKDETLLYFIKTGEDPASIPANKPYNEKPVANTNVTNKYYNKKAYTDPALRAQYSKGGYWTNIRILRYSDIVLMAAEAANELDNMTDATKYLEMVRARARGGNSSVLPKRETNDKVEMRNYIHHERRIELAMEWDRFYDLVRWGTAMEVLHAAGKTNYMPKHALLPLPQSEVDKSNGVLIQNPNY